MTMRLSYGVGLALSMGRRRSGDDGHRETASFQGQEQSDRTAAPRARAKRRSPIVFFFFDQIPANVFI